MFFQRAQPASYEAFTYGAYLGLFIFTEIILKSDKKAVLKEILESKFKCVY